ncbi:MAG: sensor histidine kinase [Gaiellales bacterium]|nr:MAG: sensor histidine kinase [Gaiellales bacterium]
MPTLDRFIEVNMVPLIFAYGLAYFIAGLVITLQRRRLSNFRLAHSLWLLGAFGIIHGAAEWGDIFIPIQSELLSAGWVRFLTEAQQAAWAISYAFLLQFGVTMVVPRMPWVPRVRFFIQAYAPLWSVSVAVTGLFLLPEQMGLSWIRYMLGFPAAALTAIAFFTESRSLAGQLPKSTKVNLGMTAAAFSVYAILAGLVVPEQTLPGLSWLSYENINASTGFPIHFWRMLTGVTIAFFVIRTLSIFDFEFRNRLEAAEKEKALARDRQRISRDLHDGVVQSLYAAGLQLEVAAREAPVAAADRTASTIRQVISQLNDVMTDMRKYIFKLGPARTGEVELDDFLKHLVDDFSADGSVMVKFSASGKKFELMPKQKQHIAMIAKECLSNVLKHAGASTVEVRLDYAPEMFTLVIEDDGTGFDPSYIDRISESAGGRGLESMAARAEAINADLDVRSAAEKGGTTVLLNVPRRKQEEDLS